MRCPDQDLASELAGSKFSIQLRFLQLEAQVVSNSQDCLRSSSCKRRLCQLLLLSQVQVPPIVYLVGDGSIDARAKRRLGNQTVEPRKGLLEELAGPAQFRPWVAGPRIVPKISILGEPSTNLQPPGFLSFNPLFEIWMWTYSGNSFVKWWKWTSCWAGSIQTHSVPETDVNIIIYDINIAFKHMAGNVLEGFFGWNLSQCSCSH